MISVLIPVYNYNIIALVKMIHEQLIDASIDFEILCLDDASNPLYSEENKTIESYSNTSYFISKENNGRIKTRQLLAKKAQFEWLLFLDADVVPKTSTFIKEYIKTLPKYDAVFGGFAYKNEFPKPEYMLRWKYGKSQEEVDASIRNTKPYKVIISANFLIKADIFNSIHGTITQKGYGFDNYFGALLKQHKANIFHINNEVYHLGIEKSEDYLSKKEQAANTLLQLVKDKKHLEHDNNLLALFLNLKRFKLNYISAFIFKLFQSYMRKNLLSANPSIKVLQLYRITYLCYKDLKTD